MRQMGPVEVRLGAPQDLESFWRCLDAVARERRYLALVEAPTLDEARAFLEDARRRGMIQQIAIAQGEVVGWCDVLPKPYEGFGHSGSLGMGLLPAYRGQGHGARLLEATLQAAREQGLTRIELEVFASNAPAIALYERRGFVREGVKRGARVLDGRTDDLVCMAWLAAASGR